MAISSTAPHVEEQIGGQRRRLLLRNGEIERFEAQHAPLGIFELFDQLFGRGPAPQVRHVRDLVALGLVGGGMTDRAADDLVASLPPSDNLDLRSTAQRLLGVTFIPAVLDKPAKKRGAGSRKGAADQPLLTTTPEAGSETSADQSPE
jgi:hypothetical protein